MSMALRVWPSEGLTPMQAQDRLRFSFIDAVKEYMSTLTLKSSSPSFSFSSFFRFDDKASTKKMPSIVLDVGCSVGVSTFYLADAFPTSKVIGLDLSPQFLAVALDRQTSSPLSSRAKECTFVHANAEAIPYDNSSVDLVAACFMFHEV